MRLLVIAFVAAAACSPEGKGVGIDVDRALAHVNAITALGPRPAGSDAARAAATYIEAELTKLGATVEKLPVGTVQLPGIEVLGKVHRKPRTETTTDPNLLARFGPSGGKALLVTAHYDSVAGSPGAVDNAASVAVLLELARAFTEDKPAGSILLAFTAAEENGLVGAEALAVQRGYEVQFVVALDLIGGDGALTLNGAGKLIGSAEMQWLAEAADRAGVKLEAPLAHRVISRRWPQAERADHGAFTRRGVRAVHFYNRGNDGEWIDLAYHSPRDVPARVHKQAIDETGRMLRAMVSLPMRDSDSDAFWVPFATNSVIPRWLLFAIGFILVLGALYGLYAGRHGIIAGRRESVPVMEDPTGRRAGLLIGAGCFIVGVGATIGAELALSGSHPAPWLHDPARAVAGSALLLLGVFGVATQVVAMFLPFTGVMRYRLVATLFPLAIGCALLALDAAEVAWIFLVPAMMVGIAPPPVAALTSAFPLVLVLYPHLVREAAWNGFLPTSLPLGVWVAALGLPIAASAGWVARHYRKPPGRRGRQIVLVISGVALAAGIALTALTKPACSAEQFERLHLACERASGS